MSVGARSWSAAAATRKRAISRSRSRLGGAGGLALLAAVVCGATEAPGALRRVEVYAAELAAIEAYLNDIGSLRSEFVQINPDGQMVTGELYYQRPDKMRIDYDPPSDILIISDGWQLIFHDRRLEQTSHLFINSTPLGFLLRDEIRFDGDVTVTAVEEIERELIVTLVKSDEPEEGSIQLTFAMDPIELRRWAVVDPQGLATYVVLEAIETELPLDRDLFRFRDPDFFPPDAR